jgi:hypothetical protein
VGVDGNPDWRRDWRRGGRSLVLRDRYFALAGRTLELVAAPKLVTRDFLVAVGADKFEFSHNVRLLIASFQFLRPGGVSRRGRECGLIYNTARNSRQGNVHCSNKCRGKTSTAPDVKCAPQSTAAVDE